MHSPSSCVFSIITACLRLILRQHFSHYYKTLKDELTDVLNCPLGLAFLGLLLLNLVLCGGFWVVVLLRSG